MDFALPKHLLRFEFARDAFILGQTEFDYSNKNIAHGGGGKGGGGSTNTVTSTSSPPAPIMAAYQNVLNQAKNVSGQPLQQYGGLTVAGFTPDQMSAFGTINNAQGAANPFINSAAQLIGQGTQPLWNNVQQFSPQNVQQYMNPYTQNVLQAAQAQQQNTDAQQQQALKGNAISSGAWGGDRAGVASAALSGQQDIANNATNAGILNQGYSQGLGEFNTQQQAQLGANEANQYLAQQGAFGLGNLGNEAFGTQLSGASAQLQSGALQQQLGQEALNVPYENFLQQQAYPFQTTQYLANISEGLGGSSGGTSSTTSPGASTASQLGGLGLGGLGIIGGTGGFGSGGWLSSLFSSGAGAAAAKGGGRIYNRGGSVPQHYDMGGLIATDVPDVSVSYIPSGSGAMGSRGMGPPTPPKTLQASQTQQGMSPTDFGNIVKLLNSMKGSGASAPSGMLGSSMGPDVAASGDSGLANMDASFGADAASNVSDFFKKGGPVRKAIGGEVLPDVISGIGDIVGAFFGMPTAGDMGVSALSTLDGGRTGGEGIEHRAFGSIMGEDNSQGGFDAGGMVGGMTPSMATSGFGTPTQQTTSSNYQNMTPEQLQMLVSRLPAGSPQARTAATILQQKRMMPNVGTQAAGGFGTQQPTTGFDDGGNVPPPPDPDTLQRQLDVQGGVSQEPSGGMGTRPAAQADQPKMYSRAPASANPWLALAEAGFATAAGNSPHALQNLGAGAMSGMANYSQQQKEADTVNEAADRLTQEAKQHRDTIAIEQQNADTNKQFRGDQAENFKTQRDLQQQQIDQTAKNNLAERQKPIPDGMGGFLIPNPKDPTNPQRINGPLGSMTDASPSGPSLANAYKAPLGADGKPLEGDAYLATLPPQVASLAKRMGDNEIQVTPYMLTRGDPATKAAANAASFYKPGWNQSSYANYNRWAFDPNGGVVAKSLDTVIPHVQLLRDLTASMNTGNVVLANKLQNKIATEFGISSQGSDIASAANLKMAQQLVGNEVVRSTIGQRGALGDREELAQNLNNATNPQILQENIDKVIMPALRAQANASEQYYKNATHLNDFRDKLLPNAKEAIWPSTPAAAAPSQTDIDYLKANPTMAPRFEKQFGAGSAKQFLGGQ